MLGPFYDNLVWQIERLRRLSAEFRIAHERADFGEMRRTSTEASSIMNNLAIEARKLQDHGCRIEDPENVGRLATEHVNEDEWDHVSRHMQLRETLKTGPLSLREALNKHVHGKVRSYRIDQGHHVLLSYGQLGNKPWIAEWTVEAFCDELKKLIVKAAQSNVSCVAGNV